jgi:hypothetical protein
VRVPSDVGRDPNQDLLAPSLGGGSGLELRGDPLEPFEVVERVEHDVPHPGLHCLA